MLSDKRPFLTTEMLLSDLWNGAQPSIGIDIAANRAKELRVIVRSVSGIWEAVVRFHKSPLITTTEPFLAADVEIKDCQSLRKVVAVARTGNGHPDDSEALWRACSQASCIAIDSPRTPFGPRTCDHIFHHLVISDGHKVIKGIGGVFWPKPELENYSGPRRVQKKAAHDRTAPNALRLPLDVRWVLAAPSAGCLPQ
jgi:hypothetical protein